MQDFSPDDYLGTWYEAYRTKGMWFATGEATTAHYTRRPDGWIGVRNTTQDWKTKSKKGGPVKDKRRGVTAWAYQPNPEKKEGKLGVKFSIFQPGYANYTVLDTDYKTFAYVYSISKGITGRITEYVWVLVREPHL